jgi:CBS domain containing-hemolysin-like protein
MSSDQLPDAKPGVINRLRTILSRRSDKGLRESLEGVIETHGAQQSEDNFGDDARSMIRNLIDFSDLRVDDVMVPRADIVALEDVATMHELLDTFTKANHSRVPIYHETLDNITGMIHVKDFLGWLAARGGKKKTKAAAGLSLPASDLASAIRQHGSLLRDVLFVPPSMPASDLLVQMKTSHVHLAIVIDEYGGTDGLASFEDLVEEIVGDISDEHDTDETALVAKQDDHTYVADARVLISALDEMFKVDLLTDEEEDEADTLGGLVFEIAGRVPIRGEILRHPSGLEFEIMETDRRRVKKVRIHVRTPDVPSDEAAGDSGA